MNTLRRIALFALCVLATRSPLTVTVSATVIPTCGRFTTVQINSAEYVYQQNEWNSLDTQCASVDDVTGAWTLTAANFNLTTNGPPATYPSTFRGCHWGNCTPNSGFPVRVGNLGRTRSSWSTTQPAAGAYNVAYDLWFNQTPTTFGQPDGAELMIWLNGRGGVQPAGSMVGTVDIAGATWEVWTTRMNNTWNYIAYRRTTGTTSVTDLDLNAFTRDAVNRGSILPSWWLIDIEAGFEIWQGGQGIGTTSFSASVVSGCGTADFDADCRSDRSVFRPSNSVWYSALSGGGATASGWGQSGDLDVAADYDGDGKSDLAVFRPSTGTWLIVQSSNGTVRVDSWGMNGDTPLAGDVDADGKADLAIFRESAGVWFIKKSTGGTTTVGWGISGDVPMLGDYDDDGKDDVAIYRPGSGVWYVLKSGGGTIVKGWGIASDIPVVGDYDGDGKTDIGIFRPGSGTWLITRSSTGTTLVASWGLSGDMPISGDHDGDGKSDFIVWRPTNGVWYTQFAVGGTAVAGWGISGDRPIGRAPGS